MAKHFLILKKAIHYWFLLRIGTSVFFIGVVPLLLPWLFEMSINPSIIKFFELTSWSVSIITIFLSTYIGVFDPQFTISNSDDKVVENSDK